MAINISADFPEPFEGLFEPHRYKVYWGGRGAAKTWNFARALLLQGAQRPLRVLCAREFQKSIQESVHQTLSDQIGLMGLDSKYEIQQAVIRGTEFSTEFFFEGIKHNTGKIKSYEGIDICWVEEAVNTSRSSWDILIPTIRKPGSEIWISFNPELETDETYQRFVIDPPSNAYVRKVNWSDNPWFPEILRVEMDDLKARDFDAYLNVWEGNCKQVLEGAVYAQELRDAIANKRITKVPYDHTKPVDTVWDLGWSDMTSIWFVQKVGFEIRIIDYLEDRLKPLDYFVKAIKNRDYVYDVDWLPHDAQAKQFSAGGLTIEEQLREKGRRVRIVPRHSLVDGIAAARAIFPNCYFDSDKCSDGIQALRHYRYDIVDDVHKTLTRAPIHDWASHAADAFRYLAMSVKQPKRFNPFAPDESTKPKSLLEVLGMREARPGPQGWMS